MNKITSTDKLYVVSYGELISNNYKLLCLEEHCVKKPTMYFRLRNSAFVFFVCFCDHHADLFLKNHLHLIEYNENRNRVKRIARDLEVLK